MKWTTLEELWKVYPNKYLAVNIAALEVRRIIETMTRDEIELPTNIYHYALRRLLRGELKYAPLSEQEMAILNQKGFEELASRRS
ncbi:MAG: hypothetical protein ACUVUD_07040 [bacterium]